MRKKIFRNWGLKLISLLLASLLWILVDQMGDPPDVKDMGSISVKLINTDLLERENKVYEILDHSDTVRVTVYAPKSVFERLRSTDIVAEADVSRLTDINTVPITFTTPVANVISIEGNREVVKLNVEDKASKYVHLECSIVGEVAEGYQWMGINPDQNRIEVTGPKSFVDQVKYAGVEIDVTDATGNLSANMDIQLYDAENNPVKHANLVTNVDYVRVSVDVLAVKDVPMEVDSMGEPAEGYMATGEIEYEPKTLKLAGSAYSLQRINSVKIPPERLDITGLDKNLQTVIDIREYLPTNVQLADTGGSGKVEVLVYVEPVAEKTLRVPENNVSVINLPAGFNAEVEPPEDGSYVIQTRGLGRYIRPLRQNEVTGTVDIAAWMQERGIEELTSGTYNIPVTFALDENVITDVPVGARVVISEVENQ